jgi:steroid 5-alpha reductase family enzyme
MFTLLWAYQAVRKDAGVVDVGWALGVGAMAVAVAASADGWLPRRILVAVLGGFWAFRLAGYILRDRILRPGEDSRYQRLRAYWGERANRNFFFFFTSQSVLVVLFALPFLPLANISHSLVRPQDVVAILIWLAAIGGESLADWQLARFRRNPRNQGKACRLGLWRYSRHPNYFCEWLHWWSYVVMGIGSSGWWLTLAGPVSMYIFLRYITGIPHTEKEAFDSLGDEYREYQKTTSMFIPFAPREPKEGHEGCEGYGSPLPGGHAGRRLCAGCAHAAEHPVSTGPAGA